MKKIFIIILILGVIGIYVSSLKANNLGALILKAPKDKILNSQEIIIPEQIIIATSTGETIIIPAKTIVQYKYISNVKANVEVRFDNSKYSNIEVIESGGIVTEYYWSRYLFSQEPDGVYEVRSGTTTIEAFKAQTKVTLLEKIFGRSTSAEDFPAEIDQGDGYISNNNADWNTVHNAASANGIQRGSWNNFHYFNAGIEKWAGSFELWRGYMPIDTSGLPDGANITAAELNVFVWIKNHNIDDAYDYINVVQSTQSSTASLIAADFDQCGTTHSPTLLATQVNLADVTAGNYAIWTLNQAGRDAVSDTGYTKLGLRIGNDLEDVAYSGGDGTLNRFLMRTGYHDTVGEIPYLAITYSVSTCTYSGSGDWEIIYSDRCFITSTVYVNGAFNLINDGAGSFGTEANISATKFNIAIGTKIDCKKGIDCFSGHD